MFLSIVRLPGDWVVKKLQTKSNIGTVYITVVTVINIIFEVFKLSHTNFEKRVFYIMKWERNVNVSLYESRKHYLIIWGKEFNWILFTYNNGKSSIKEEELWYSVYFLTQVVENLVFSCFLSFMLYRIEIFSSWYVGSFTTVLLSKSTM